MTTQQTILITGATSGIGRHTALYLAERGFRVFATGRRPDALARLADDARGLSLETLVLDVTDAGSIAAAKAMIDERTAGHGIDVLVNNAGYGTAGPLEETSDADLRRQYDTNVFGLMAVTRAFVPGMRERGSGRVINVSSVGGKLTFPMFGAYNSTKYAVEALSDALRLELRPFGVQVVLIEPGPIDTNFSATTMGEVQKYRRPSSPYAPVLARADQVQAMADKRALHPDVIARDIHRAIRARRPRARYMAPRSAALLIGLLKLLPTRWSDAMIARVVGLTRANLQRAATPSQLPAG